MELTIEQALQKGIYAQKEGNLEEAERFYRAILQSQPLHPDANHNLGLIAVSVNKVALALPLFKTALKANSKIEQFWLSYIDALIKENHLETVKIVLSEARKVGLVGDKVDTLEAQLKQITQSALPKLPEKKTSLTLKEKRNKIAESKQPKIHKKGKNANSLSPSQSQVDNLLKYYKNGRYGEAEKLAVTITQQFPEYLLGWRVLGAVFGSVGRKSDAINANQRAVQIDPKDALAHYNLGKTLQDSSRLEEAEASYRQAIALRPTFAQAQYNLGNILNNLGRLEEAEASYRQAIAINPGFADAYNNLGITLKEMGKLEEAEASYRQVIAINPGFAEAHNNLGATLKEMGKLEETEECYRQAIVLKPDHAAAHYNLGVYLFEIGQYGMAAEQFELNDISLSKQYAIRCSYLQDEETVFYEKLDFLINQGEINAVIGSLIFCSDIKYGIKKSNPFCNEPLKFVVKTNLNEQYDFENIFIKTARDVLIDNSVSFKEQKLLTNGTQTAGNLFSLDKVFRTEIESIIHAEIEKYRVHFKDSEEGFIKNWPTSYNIYGWLVCMQSGGKLKSHMHHDGWISGSVYINVPSKSKTNSGNLVVCLSDEEHVPGMERRQESIIDVVTGSLCLFPSSLHHYTVPFEEKENRIVLAFDVIPTQ